MTTLLILVVMNTDGIKVTGIHLLFDVTRATHYTGQRRSLAAESNQYIRKHSNSGFIGGNFLF